MRLNIYPLHTHFPVEKWRIHPENPNVMTHLCHLFIHSKRHWGQISFLFFFLYLFGSTSIYFFQGYEIKLVPQVSEWEDPDGWRQLKPSLLHCTWSKKEKSEGGKDWINKKRHLLSSVWQSRTLSDIIYSGEGGKKESVNSSLLHLPLSTFFFFIQQELTRNTKQKGEERKAS